MKFMETIFSKEHFFGKGRGKMVNSRHLNILKQGVDAWNKWREDHPFTDSDKELTDYGSGRSFGAPALYGKFKQNKHTRNNS